MKKAVFIFLCISLTFISGASEGQYPVSAIPPALLKDANAVVRVEDTRFEIVNTRQTVLKYHCVITILNENGDPWAELQEYYDKYRHVESIEGALYDSQGKQIKKIKKKDIEDWSGVADESLIDDNRIKRHKFYYSIYPYTIEYMVEISDKQTLFFPRWVPQAKEHLSVEQNSISVVCPNDYEFRYKAFNYPTDPIITREKNNKVMTWAVKDMPAIVKEAYSPLWHEMTTVVLFGPTDFQVDGYKGNMLSWQDFGRFVHSLKQGKDQLPENIKQVVHQISDGINDPVEKVTRLYKYLQNNTRYVSIQLGIGGWQPFDATYVATRRYGDCKALTNYMYSILKEAGIASYYCLVRAGKFANYITADFPSQQFNHVILCVPLSKDTLWLECTSQTMQAGYLGEFTSGRYALLVDENGGKLVGTPRYGMNENQQVRNIRARLEDNGTLQLKVATRYSGLQQDDIHGLINQLSKDRVKEYLHEQFDFATYDVNSFNYREEKGKLPVIREDLEITVSNYATATGKRLFIVPNVMTRTYRKLTQDTSRKYDIQLGVEYRDVDSVEIELPVGYKTEAMPEDVAISTVFGKYSCSVKLKDNKLCYYRSIEYPGGRFPASDYAALARYFETIYKADRNKVVLIRE